MARQRYCRRLARYQNTVRVSADLVAKRAAHTRAESRGSRRSKGDAGERRTLCWREMDSNFQFRARRAGVLTGLYRRRPSKVFAFPPKRPVSCTRDRWFESVSLQRRVRTTETRRGCSQWPAAALLRFQRCAGGELRCSSSGSGSFRLPRHAEQYAADRAAMSEPLSSVAGDEAKPSVAPG
jgi:predicted dithiol-disulfide oxidoreductase (DUF899 family)